MPLLPPSARDPRGAAAAHPRVIPALYATPEFAPLPETAAPSSFPPSPYVVNHKRRGPRLLKTLSQPDVAAPPDADPPGRLPTSRSFSAGDVSAGAGNGEAEVAEAVEAGRAEAEVEVEKEAAEVGVDVEADDFFDPRDSMSVASSPRNPEEVANGRWKAAGGLAVSTTEYYDAFEEISSDGVAQSPARIMESELHEMRLNVLMEIEKRKQAEDALVNLQNCWRSLSSQLSLVGISLPALSTITEEKPEKSCFDTEELQQQVVLARLVAESIGRGSARAEVEIEMETQIEAKNFEIARLLDRLHYYEAANHEMSQRNQEAVERARRQRQMRKRRQRWIWGSIGITIAIGAAAAAWSHFHSSSLPAQPEDSGSEHQNN